MELVESPIKIVLSKQERKELEHIANSRKEEHRMVERSKIILNSADGVNNCQNARMLGISVKTVRKWRKCYHERRLEKADSKIKERISDAHRKGHKPKFDAFFWVDLTAIATSDPKESQRPITEWTQRELSEEVVKRGLVESIHPTTVGRFLASLDLKPHRVRGWMNRKDDPEFDERASDVKECLVNATSNETPKDEVVVSFDEKTGMQAKERIAQDHPMQPGQPKRLEFEYERHGTLVLFGMLIVSTGQILAFTKENRTNNVTADILYQLFLKLFDLGYERIHVLLDQLNTHWSKPLIGIVATLCQIPLPPDSLLKTGSMRRLWLSNPNKSIVFHFTPKHASWLNPIEIWFGVLVRKFLRHGSFDSKDDLAAQLSIFINYYNERMAHPYKFKKWKREQTQTNVLSTAA